MDSPTLQTLVNQKDGHELSEFHKILKARHLKFCNEEESSHDALETLVSYTEHYKIQTVEDFHKHLRVEAESIYDERQKTNAPGSQDSDWYKAVHRLILEALKIYSPKKAAFTFNPHLSIDEPAPQGLAPQPPVADHP